MAHIGTGQSNLAHPSVFGCRKRCLDRTIALLGLAVAASCGGLRMIGGGGAWRTLQPSPEDIEFAVSELGVRTVISLRAPAPGKSWYDAEAAACERLGVAFLSLGWSAKSVPDAAIDALIDAFRDHPGPYLLHCRAGKDRTSLAAAVYRHAVLGHPADEADDEMRLFPYGHSAVFGYGAIDEAWRRYVER